MKDGSQISLQNQNEKSRQNLQIAQTEKGKKSRMKDYLDNQGKNEDYDEESPEADINENSLNAHQRAKMLKIKTKKGGSSDFDDAERSLGRQMRIASSGRNLASADKDAPSRSDHNELASIEDRSFDPDHEPRKEGTMKMKHSPSVAEIVPNIDGLSEGASIGNERSLKRGSVPRSPARIIQQHVTDNEDDSDYRSLNRDSKNTRSNRKLKPNVGYQNNKILKVV